MDISNISSLDLQLQQLLINKNKIDIRKILIIFLNEYLDFINYLKDILNARGWYKAIKNK